MSESNGAPRLADLEFDNSTPAGLALNNLVSNLILERRSFMNMFDKGNRDIDAECGYPPEVALSDYDRMWSRKGVAKRVGTIYAREGWKVAPSVYESENPEMTPFETDWDNLVADKHVYSYLRRADELSGIGRYGLLILGIGDGKTLDKPAAGLDEEGKPTKERPKKVPLLYLRPVAETKVRLEAGNIQKNQLNPRYGQPVTYNVRLGDETNPTAETKVHWTRVIHLCRNRTDSEVYGTPELEDVWDYLLDVRKIGGSSAEMFYKGGFPGLSAKALPGVESMDTEGAKKQVKAYQDGLSRVLATFGIEWQSLAPQVADPTAHIDLQLMLIAVAKGVPMRILLGSERGELSSAQDTEEWNGRLGDYREGYLSPFVLRPFVDRMVYLGVIESPAAEPDTGKLLYETEWPDPNAMTDQEVADLALTQTKAMGEYMIKGVNSIAGTEAYMTQVLRLPEDVAKALIKGINDVVDQEALDAAAVAAADASNGDNPANA